MKLDEIYKKSNKPVISFEVFPPKNDESGEKLDKMIESLKNLNRFDPAIVSLTYGAGGSNQNSSLNIIKRLQKEFDFNVMPHFTCVNSTFDHVNDYLREIKELKIENVLALRGDIPDGVKQENFDFQYANKLVKYIKANTDFSIAVAGYPEIHIECDDLTTDLVNLKRKVDEGGSVIYTQMCFDNSAFYKFKDHARKMGINVPIAFGVLPIMNFKQLGRMLLMGRVSLPSKLSSKLEKFQNDSQAIKQIGIEHATKQCKDLIKNGIEGLHFYTLNTHSSVEKILDNL